MSHLGGRLPGTGDIGPTKTLLEPQQFDEVRLLTNYLSAFNAWFAKWLGVKPLLIEVPLEKPTDYAAIFQIANRENC